MEYNQDKNINSEIFTIGQVAEITGISRDRLRYYESKGILYPTQNKDNNYRSYSISDIDTILSIEFYRSMDLSMKEISAIWASDEPSDIANVLDKKELAISSKIDELHKYLRNIQKGKDACDKISKNMNKFSVQPMPAFEVLGEISDFRSFSEYKEIHNRKVELEGNAIVNSIKRIITFSEKGIEDNKMLITKNIKANTTEGTNILEYDRCLYTIVEDSVEKDMMEEMFEKSLKWASENNLKCKGIVIINMILITVNEKAAKSYLEIFAPIE
ncbi:MerR family transcriptional regulator [Clostridium estertheticum]|uniref:MerR family transcriptional regulator n=1 Tax=Clostridium estertheticum TaxID=238834 RepID=UPI001C6EF945|nr:MerR family transcriptional regulator [Clostridium estertheticum]MBW9172813.1 MerR family transcriptional regulator [Clostridium estertheticum]WLC77664.1 MerR family transcriptional regulator [Clostridium estertheticum]